jgi:ornithine carbamoyltransferase
VNELNRAAGRRLVWQTENPQAAVKGVHFVYTDVWASMGQEAEQAQRVRDFSPFQVTTELLALADPDVKFLHCLPARRGEEVAAEVIDGPASAIVLQAENRLHAQKGMLAWLQEQQR